MKEIQIVVENDFNIIKHIYLHVDSISLSKDSDDVVYLSVNDSNKLEIKYGSAIEFRTMDEDNWQVLTIYGTDDGMYKVSCYESKNEPNDKPDTLDGKELIERITQWIAF
jgi:hypothetical protein